MDIQMQEALTKASSEEVSPSEVEVKTEAETTEVEAEAEAKVETEVVEKEELFETPDGRKVNATQLQKEWKENFLPDYTRKSQKIAEIEKVNNKEKEVSNVNAPKWKDPDWVPESYAEIIALAKEEAKADLQKQQQEEIEKRNQVESAINNQLTEIKKLEPNLNEDLLFQHANKYQFSDLKIAYENMKEMKLAIKKTEEKVVSNIKAREADIVSAGNKAGASQTGTNYWEISNDRGSARDYLSRVSQK
jgi:DNA repair exonuclease SbcCD ATPase subunit